MKKTTLRQAALKLAIVALAVLAPLGLRAQQSLPYSYGFEDNDLAAAGWTAQVTSSSSGINSQAAHEGSYGFQFNYSEQNAYLVSPLLTGTDNGVALSFYYKEYSASYGDEQFYVGYTTNETVTDPSAFTYGDITTASTSWQLYEASLPAGTKRVAIKYVYNDAFYLFLDDFTFNAPASCPKPTGLTCTATTGTPATATLSWTNGGTETNWVLEYSTAADFTGATTINISDGDLNDGTYTLTTGLTAETRYYVHLKADCGGGDESEWSNTIDFKPSNVQNIPIGSGNSTTNYFPSHTNWKYSYTQQIYTASEIGQAGTIKSISFKGNKAGTRSWVIYLVNTTKESFSSTNDFIPIADATQVFNDNVTLVANDWTTIELDGDGFDYDGGNLAIIVDDNSGNYSMGSTTWAAFSTASTNQALYFYQDSGTPANIDPTSPNASNKNISTDKSQIKLGILPSNTPKPRNLHFDNVTSIAATMIWEEPNITPDSYEYQYKESTATDWPTDWTTNGTNLSVTLSLSASTTYDFRVRAVYSEGESDPVEIQFTTLDNCAYPTNLTATTTPGQGTKATLTWTKGYDETAWELQYSTDNFVSDIHPVTEGFIIDGNTVTANLTGLTAEESYSARVKAVCSATSSSSWSNVEFNPTNYVNYTYNDGATSSTTYHPFSGYYTTNATNQSQFVIPAAELSSDIIGGTIRSITYYTTSTATTDWGGVTFDVYMAEVENSTFSYYATFVDWDNLNNVYTGTVSLSNGMMTIAFDQNYTYNGGNLLIGFKTNTPGTTTQSISWTASYQSGAYNIAYQTGSSAYGSTYFPKITFNYLPTAYPRVAEVNEGTITETSVELSWDAPNENVTGYAYQYKKAADANWPAEWTNTTATTITIPSLDPSTTYNFRIKALYGSIESVETTTSFATECGVVTTFPWRENFDTRSIGNFSDPCWVNEHLTVVGDDNASKVFIVEASNNENRINLLKLPDESIGNTIKLRLPQMTLPNNNYQFVLDVYRSNSTYNNNYPDEGIRVYASTDGEIEGATELTFIPRQYNVSSTLIPQETAEGWYTYEIPIGISGTCYIILRGESQYCTSTYIDNLTVEEIPSCARPTDLAKSDVTNHSATLTWTAGDENQHNWQVAYSKTSFDPNTASFDINTVETIDFTTSTTCTYRMDRLFDAASTYYLYIRANCGTATEPDYGPWSRNGINLTTSAAAPAPSAFTASNIASTKVDLVWNAGGGDYELSWDLYYVQSDDAPEAPTATTEATKIVTTLPTTEVPYELDDLAEESRYYIWVRANHGTDGNSGWVALTGDFFTTLAACSAQDPIVSNITHNTATVTWDGESQDGFTVKYRTSAGISDNSLFSEDFEDETTFANWTFTSMNTANDIASGKAGCLADAKHNGDYGFRFSSFSTKSEGTYDQYLVSPELNVTGVLNFFYKKYNNNTETLQVGYSTTTDDYATAFTWIDLDLTTSWQQSEDITLPDNVKYIAFHYYANCQYYVYLDDINIWEPTHAGAWQTKDATDNTATITSLTAETKYDVKVVPDCDETQESTIVTFTTKSLFEKVIEANKWYAIASPMHNDGNNETLAGVNNLTSGTYDLYGYNEGDGTWEKPTTSLNRGKGYIYRRSEGTTLQFVGDANTGSVSVSLTSSCSDNDLKGFNLIGNPYPHAVAISQPHYTLNPNGTWTAHTSNNTIGVAEAFLVYSPYSYYNTYDFSDVTPSTNTASASLAFTVSTGEYSDVAYARLEEGEGLPKIGHLNSEAPMLSIPVEGRRYAIANLGSDCQSFNLVFRGVNGTYTIKQSSNQAIAYCHLIDRVAGKDIDMLRQNYTFSSNGFDADRFMVKLSPDAQENANGNFAYWNGNNWMVEGNGTLQVFDALGRQLFSQEISNSNFEIQNSLFPAAGVYVLRMGEKTQKIVVR